MRCLVSILFILLLMTGMSSCRRTAAPVHYEVPVEAEDSLDADTLPEESSEMRELEASLNLDRVFDDFMYAFVRSPRLQRERVHYPLPVVTADSLQDTLVRYLDCASEFGFMMGDFYTLLFSHPSQMEESKSADEETVRVERINLHEMQVRSFDFERRHGKWMLIGLEDKGVGQSDCADFLEFYAHLSTDSLFQSRHLARRLRHLLPGLASGEGIEDASNDAYRHFGSFGFLLRGDIGDVIDEDEGMVEQFFSGVGERGESPCGLERHSHIHIIGIVLSAGLDEGGVEGGVRDGVARQTKPDSHHLYLHHDQKNKVEQSLHHQ